MRPELTLEYALKTGLRKPIRFNLSRPPGLVVPDDAFSVEDVRYGHALRVACIKLV